MWKNDVYIYICVGLVGLIFFVKRIIVDHMFLSLLNVILLVFHFLVGKIGLSRLRSEEVLEISASIGSQPPKQHTTGGYADANLNSVNFPLAKYVCDFWCKPLEFARDRKHERSFYSILQVVIPVELLQHLQELVAKSYNFACLVAKWRCHHQAREIEHKRHLDVCLWHRISFISFHG